jgi:hypothetical protein
MNIKSFGCSFIFGSDLSDIKENPRGGTAPSNLTWPALLAQLTGHGYICHARPGSGNLQIAEKVLTQVFMGEPCLYIIGWSWIDRFDYTDSANRWKTIMPIDVDERAKIYYRDMHSQMRDKLASLIAIKSVISTLEEKKLPYIMTYMDDLMFESDANVTPGIKELQNYIRLYMTTFGNKTFLDWSRVKGFKESKAWHPLDDAHRAAAEFLINSSDIQSIFDRVRLF